MFGRLRATAGRLMAWEYRDSHKGINRRSGPVNGLYGGLLFLGYAPPCWTRAQNSRLLAVGRRTSGGKMVEGTGIWAGRCRPLKGIKTAPGLTRGGSCDIQDFFAVPQITIKGRARINRIIKRGSPPRRFVGTAADHQADNHIVPDHTCSALGIGCNLSGPSRPGCAC